MFLIRVQFATFATAIKLYITVGAGYSTEKSSFGYGPNEADQEQVQLPLQFTVLHLHLDKLVSQSCKHHELSTCCRALITSLLIEKRNVPGCATPNPGGHSVCFKQNSSSRYLPSMHSQTRSCVLVHSCLTYCSSLQTALQYWHSSLLFQSSAQY